MQERFVFYFRKNWSLMSIIFLKAISWQLWSVQCFRCVVLSITPRLGWRPNMSPKPSTTLNKLIRWVIFTLMILLLYKNGNLLGRDVLDWTVSENVGQDIIKGWENWQHMKTSNSVLFLWCFPSFTAHVCDQDGGVLQNPNSGLVRNTNLGSVHHQDCTLVCDQDFGAESVGHTVLSFPSHLYDRYGTKDKTNKNPLHSVLPDDSNVHSVYYFKYIHCGNVVHKLLGA